MAKKKQKEAKGKKSLLDLFDGKKQLVVSTTNINKRFEKNSHRITEVHAFKGCVGYI